MLSWQFTHTGVVPPRSAVSQKTCVVPVDKVSGRTHRLHPLFALAEVHLVVPVPSGWRLFVLLQVKQLATVPSALMAAV